MYMYEVIGINNYDKVKNYKDNLYEWIVLYIGIWICYIEIMKKMEYFI